jgi:hypothetical protein
MTWTSPRAWKVPVASRVMDSFLILAGAEMSSNPYGAN